MQSAAAERPFGSPSSEGGLASLSSAAERNKEGPNDHKAFGACSAVAVLGLSGPGAFDGDPGDAHIANALIGCGCSLRPGAKLQRVANLCNAMALSLR